MKSDRPITHITADTTCDLSPDLLEKNAVRLIPLYISLGDKTYRDGAGIDPQALYQYFEETGELPKTAAPSPDDFYAIFSRLALDGGGIVHIGISSEMSASCNNALIAAKRLDNVHIVDSRNLSTGIGLAVLHAAELAATGLSAEQIVEALKKDTERAESSFIIDTLTYLHKGGRCSSVAALGSNLLKIKPCIEVRDGQMQVSKKYQGSMKRCIEKYIKDRLLNRRDLDLKRVFITSTVEDLALIDHCREVVLACQPFEEVLIARAGSTIASHCGPGTLGIFFFRKP